MNLIIKRKGIEYVLKTCPHCGDEWYARKMQNRCALCGSGLVRRTPENIDLNWDELPKKKPTWTPSQQAIIEGAR